MIRPHAQGVVIRVRAQPGAKRNAVVGTYNGMLKLAVTAPPDKGRANEALAELLAATLQVKRHQVELIQGPTHANKQFLVRGITDAHARKLLFPTQT